MSDRVMESIPLIGSLVQAGAGVAGVVLSALGLRKRDPARRSPSTDDVSSVFRDRARDNVVAGDYASVATRGGVVTDVSAGDRGVAAARDVNIYGTPTPTATLALHQLPPPPADFVGRADELEKLTSEMEAGDTISGVRGMGGVGKTALALVVARRLGENYPDAEIYLNLHGASEQQPLTTAEAMAHVIRSFHPEARLPESEAELAPLYHSTLHNKRVLILMDNAADRDQVEPLIPPQGCAMLVTSRQLFTLPGLTPVNVDVLGPEEAQELLLVIAPRVGDRAPELAERCGHLPLALRLAGNALKERPDLGVEGYLGRLEDAKARLELADASLDLSYRLLSSDLQQRWCALAAFPETFDHPAAAAVWEMEPDAAKDALGELLRYSLLEWSDATDRYRLHDLARLFAGSRLGEGEAETAGRRHAQNYVAVLALADDLYLKGGEEMMRALALFDLEWANIETGQVWAAARAEGDDAAARLCSDYGGAANLLSLRHHPRQRVEWLEAALASARRLKDRRAEGNHLGNLGLAYFDLGEPRRAIEYHEQALEVMRETGDRRGEGSALGNLGLAYADLGELRRAIGHYEQQLEITREIGHRRGEGNALGSLGIAYRNLEEPRRAIEQYEQALEIAREIGDRQREGAALGNLGIAYADLGEPRRAIDCHEQALEISREIGDRHGEGNALAAWATPTSTLGNRAAPLRIMEGGWRSPARSGTGAARATPWATWDWPMSASESHAAPSSTTSSSWR